MITLKKLVQVEDYSMPFDSGADGFNEWWTTRIGSVGEGHDEWLSFIENGEELARAEVDYSARLAANYVGPQLPRNVIDITFFEVREDRRREGIGKQAVSLIVQRYSSRVLIAFSEGADKFWLSIGWVHYPRTDESTLYRPLYARDDRPSLGRVSAS